MLVNVNLGIQKRSKLAFVGDSGSGKSTLVDIIMGFHYPVSGRMYVDETLVSDENLTSWRKKSDIFRKMFIFLMVQFRIILFLAENLIMRN